MCVWCSKSKRHVINSRVERKYTVNIALEMECNGTTAKQWRYEGKKGSNSTEETNSHFSVR